MIGIGIAVWIALSTIRRRGADPDTEELAHREKGWLFVAAGMLAVLLLATIFFVPYGKSAASAKQTVEVTAQQFAFVIKPASIKVDTPTEFVLTSKDATHGFGVFDPDGVFVFQEQVIPEHTTVAVWTFKKTGRYRVVCFEFCGVGHARMLSGFEVTR